MNKIEIIIGKSDLKIDETKLCSRNQTKKMIKNEIMHGKSDLKHIKSK